MAEARTVFEPIAQPPSRLTVIAIVGFDHAAFALSDSLGLAKLQVCLHLEQRLIGVVERCFAFIAVERLETLDRIALDARPYALSHDGEKVHEPFTAQQLIKLLLARGVATHQSFQRGGLIRRKVIDVQIGISIQAIHYEVDELLECGALLRSR